MSKTGKAIRKSVYFADEVWNRLHLSRRDDGGLSARIASIVSDFDEIYRELLPGMTRDQWSEIFDAMDMHEGDIQAIGEQVELEDMTNMTSVDWIMIFEAHYRYKIAVINGSSDAILEAIGEK